MRFYFLIASFLILQIGLSRIGFSQGTAAQQEALEAFEADNLEQAFKLFEAVYESGDKAEGAYYLGRIALKNDQSEKAIGWLEEATERNDQDADYQYWLSEAYFNRIDKVGMLKKAGLAKKGRKAAERSVQLEPTHKDARTTLVYFFTQAPPIAGGSIEKAIEHADVLKTHHPKRGRMMRAMIHSNQEEHDLADAEYAALVAEYPEDADIIYASAMHVQGRKKYQEAMQLFEQALEVDPSSLNALYQVGRTAVLAEDWLPKGEAALTDYLSRELTENVPSHASAWWRLGMLYNLGDKTDDARKAFTSALELDPDHKEAKAELGKLGL